MSPVPSAGKRVRVSQFVKSIGLLLIGRESGARFFNQSQSVAVQNQSNCGITFDTQLKSAVMHGHQVSPLATWCTLAWLPTVCWCSKNHSFFYHFFKPLQISFKFRFTPALNLTNQTKATGQYFRMVLLVCKNLRKSKAVINK